ncbi:hypothetical protein VNO80_14174 [Phaseolus coccineus]|uniref:Secreted protein n=1 Tax=Phaseolus coccineus TaxID=3886 RepID=A0AAN9R0N6_PHACN
MLCWVWVGAFQLSTANFQLTTKQKAKTSKLNRIHITVTTIIVIIINHNDNNANCFSTLFHHPFFTSFSRNFPIQEVAVNVPGFFW